MGLLDRFETSPVWSRKFQSRDDARSFLFGTDQIPLSDSEQQDMDSWMQEYAESHRGDEPRRWQVRRDARAKLEENGGLVARFGIELGAIVLVYYVLAIILLIRQLRDK